MNIANLTNIKNYEKFTIKNIEHLKNSTIYYFLKNLGFSENYIKNLRNTPNSIILNGKQAKINDKIIDNDTLFTLKNPNTATKIAICEGKLEILYEDEDYLIVNKPHNIACMPSRSHYNNNLGGQIVKYMQEKDPNFVLRIINRLDKDTAGIVCVAKNPIAYNNLKLEKIYCALCYGKFIEEKFTIDKPIETISENGINQMQRIISENGKKSITHVEVVKSFENYSLAKFKLETGRTHQIRVHLSSINHPLIGDKLYAKQEFLQENFPDEHTFLILKSIKFVHFRTKREICISVNFPDEWQPLLK